MRILVKQVHSTFELEIGETATVEELRQTCADKLTTKPSDLVLIYKGKMMKDRDLLSTLEVKDECCVHCVIKAPTQTPTNSVASPSPQTRPQNTPPVQALTAQSTQPSFADPLSYPPSMRPMGDNAELARMMSSPNFIELLCAMDPRVKTIMDANPEYAAMMRNPETIRQLIELAQNPTTAMQNQDRMLAQLENIPGGMNQLLRTVVTMNRPIANQNQSPSTPVANAGQSNWSTANVAGEAMPNPWASSTTIPAATTAAAPMEIDTAPTPTPRRSGAVDNDVLFRELMNALRLGNSIDPVSASPFIDSIRTGVANLSPRGQYGVTEYAKGLEIIRDEAPELLVHMLNYQLNSIRQTLDTEDAHTPGASNSAAFQAGEPHDDTVPPEKGDENTYQSQLLELKNMGFSIHDENLAALQYSYGDVTAAVDWILRRRGFQ